MSPGVYALALAVYPALLFLSLAVGMLGIQVNQRGSRRVGVVMIACQLTLLILATWVNWPGYRMAGMTIVNGLSAVPLLITPPSPPYRLQRIAAGLFLSSSLLNATFGMFDLTPALVAILWFSSAAIDAAMIIMLGGFCGGVVGKDIAAWLRRHACAPSHSGDRR